MRPEILYPLFAETTSLSGVGPRVAIFLERLAGRRLLDLIWHLPTGLIDRRPMPTIATAIPGSIATMRIHVDQHHVPAVAGRRIPYRIEGHDETGNITLTFFHGREDYLRKMLPEGEVRIISGKVEDYRGDIQMSHPDYMVPEDQIDDVRIVEPQYPLTQGLTQRPLRKAISGALEAVPPLPEWHDRALLVREEWPDFNNALTALHQPDGPSALEPGYPARKRLAYDELLANQLALALIRRFYA